MTGGIVVSQEAGMTEQALTRVALYTFARHDKRRVAEFRWQPGQAVSLTVLDPEWSAPAQDFYDNGVPVGAGRVPPEAGPEFMRALLQRFRMSYYKFVDESDGAGGPSQGASEAER
ncbi:hypothetical protein I0C86_23250 [Plantactinospora sp. S1510]|uniref:Uncharacterized protein n=1 Tax=Plantactinospora alkalitolerans TaxID=2789879 RepID=A0ABS0H118_9ACTN|nr:hypothetical protein [Plantactinospora alkalitolerans]MBF9131859.1 hypothetical protein [Plantactinospora alkalitolerans]